MGGLEDLHLTLHNPSLDKIEAARSANGDIDNAVLVKGAPVVDADDFGFPIGEICDLDLGAEGEFAMSSGAGFILKPFAGCGCSPAICLYRIPRHLTVLDGLDSIPASNQAVFLSLLLIGAAGGARLLGGDSIERRLFAGLGGLHDRGGCGARGDK